MTNQVWYKNSFGNFKAKEELIIKIDRYYTVSDIKFERGSKTIKLTFNEAIRLPVISSNTHISMTDNIYGEITPEIIKP